MYVSRPLHGAASGRPDTLNPKTRVMCCRTYAPVTKTKFVKEIGAKEYLKQSPAKRARVEQFYEDARRQASKNMHKLTESKPVATAKVIEKKPALYNESKNATDEPPKPKRIRQRRKPEQKVKSDAEKDLDKAEAKDAASVAELLNELRKELLANKASDKQTETNQKDENQLDDITANVLQDELKQIMIKVWQELPDSPPTDAEDVVADKFRNEAGDDLMNAMGLNVTARLLNLHNPLYAKLYFSGKPEAGCLQAFISEHKITAFKRIAHSDRDVFAARFDHIADFDRLCVHSEVKCGSATVGIVPCYKYFSSPPSLKSVYADSIAKIKNKTDSSQEKTDTNKKEKVTDKNKIVNAEGKKATEKEVAKTPNATKTVTAPTKAEEKTVTVKTTQEKPKTVVKETPKAPVEVTPNKVDKTVKATTQEKPKPKETVKAVSAETKKVTPKKVENNVTKDKKVKDSFDDMMVVDEEIGEEDDEEMTDQDILALMSGGIVLDECSGTDDEK